MILHPFPYTYECKMRFQENALAPFFYISIILFFKFSWQQCKETLWKETNISDIREKVLSCALMNRSEAIERTHNGSRRNANARTSIDRSSDGWARQNITWRCLLCQIRRYFACFLGCMCVSSLCIFITFVCVTVCEILGTDLQVHWYSRHQ